MGTPPMRHLPSLRQLLLLLTVACVVPMAGLALGLVAYDYQRERHQLESDTIGTARALIAAVDDGLARTEGALMALSRSTSLATRDFARLRDEALVLQQSVGAANLLLLDEEGRQLMNTAQPPGAILHAESWPQMLEAIRRKEPIVLDLFRVPLTNEWRVGVSVPLADARGMLALSATIDPAVLREVLARQKLPPGWIASVLDGTGAIVARTHDHGRFMGTRARAALVARIAEVPEDAVESVTVDGVPVITAFSRSAHSGWSVVIGMPRSELQSGLLRSTAVLLLGTAAVLVLTLAFAWRMARSLGTSVEALGSAVRATGHRGRLDLPEPTFQEAWQLGLAFAHAHAALEDANTALATSEARMAAVLDTASDAIVTADERGKVVLFNHAAERMFQRRADDVLGQSVESLLPPSLRAQHRQRREAVTPSGAREMAQGRVVEGVRADGTAFRARAAISVAENGESRLYTVMLREIPADAAVPA